MEYEFRIDHIFNIVTHYMYLNVLYLTCLHFKRLHINIA